MLQSCDSSNQISASSDQIKDFQLLCDLKLLFFVPHVVYIGIEMPTAVEEQSRAQPSECPALLAPTVQQNSLSLLPGPSPFLYNLAMDSWLFAPPGASSMDLPVVWIGHVDTPETSPASLASWHATRTGADTAAAA